MKRMISVFDLRTGEVSLRSSYTQTFDMPKDFDRSLAIATLDDRFRARYVSIVGRNVVAPVSTRPLSWRVRGEECLVADADGFPTLGAPARYTLVTVDPARA